MKLLATLAILSFLAPRRDPTFEVVHFSATIDDVPVVVIERPGYARILAPYFKANATVRVDADEDYTIGFLQQVDALDFKIDYARATTSWEMPKLPHYDCASVARPPWYGTIHEIARVRRGEVSVAMDDNLVASMTWAEPLPPDGENVAEKEELSRVKRKQSFTTWLVARRDSDGAITVLRKVTWSIEFEVEVDVAQPVGKRCKPGKSPVRQPEVSESGAVPEEVLKGPGANEAQQFWWTPKKDGIGKRTRLR